MSKKQKLDYTDKLRPRISITPKIIIFSGLFLFSIVSVYLSNIKTDISWWPGLWINISAGSIGSLFTIFVIDYLINKGKTSKLIAVNKLNHHGLLTSVQMLMLRIMKNFGYISKKELVRYIDNAEIKFEEFISEPKLLDKLDSLNQLNKDNLRFIKKINKTLEKGWEYLAKNIKDFKPYPDPQLVHKISVEMAYNSGAVSVGEDLFRFYFDKLPRKVSRKEINKMQPGMTVLWRIIADGLFQPNRSYKNYYLNSFKLLIELSNRCKKENVFFDI